MMIFLSLYQAKYSIVVLNQTREKMISALLASIKVILFLINLKPFPNLSLLIIPNPLMLINPTHHPAASTLKASAIPQMHPTKSVLKRNPYNKALTISLKKARKVIILAATTKMKGQAS